MHWGQPGSSLHSGDALMENGPWPATIQFPYSPHICLSWLLERSIFSLRPPFLLPAACPPCFWDHLAGKKCRQLRKRHGKGAEQPWHRQLPGGLFLQLDLAPLSLSVLHRHFFSFLKHLLWSALSLVQISPPSFLCKHLACCLCHSTLVCPWLLSLGLGQVQGRVDMHHQGAVSRRPSP